MPHSGDQPVHGARHSLGWRHGPLTVAAIVFGLAGVSGLDALGLPRPALIWCVLAAVTMATAWLTWRHRNDVSAAAILAGRAVTPPSRGLTIAAGQLPLAALLGIFGALYTSGIDGLVFVLGLGCGLVIIPILLAAPLRRSQAVCMPDFIGLRYGGLWPRRLAIVVLTLAGLLVAAAELTAIGVVSERVAGVPFQLAVVASAGAALALAWAGGQSAAARLQRLLIMVLAAALLTPLILLTFRIGLPVAQLGYGPALAEIADLEQGLLRRALAEARSLRPHLVPFLATDILNQFGIALGLMLGTAALAHVTSGVFEASTPKSARWSFVWAVAILVLLLTALPGLAALTKLEILQTISRGARLDALPPWIFDWGRLGVVRVCGVAAIDIDTVTAACRKIARHPGQLRLQDLAVDAEFLLLALPRITGLGFALTTLLAAGLLAAVLATLPALLLSVATLTAQHGPVRPADVAQAALRPESHHPLGILLPITAATAAALAIARPADMLTLLVWGSAVAAAGLFPALWLGIWWRRANAAGAVAGMLTGLGSMLLYVLATRYFAPQFHALFAGLTDVAPAAQRRFADLQQVLATAAPGPAREAAAAALDIHAQRIAGWFGVRGIAAALFAVPAGLLALVLASLVTRAPAAELRERLALWRRPPRR